MWSTEHLEVWAAGLSQAVCILPHDVCAGPGALERRCGGSGPRAFSSQALSSPRGSF